MERDRFVCPVERASDYCEWGRRVSDRRVPRMKWTCELIIRNLPRTDSIITASKPSHSPTSSYVPLRASRTSAGSTFQPFSEGTTRRRMRPRRIRVCITRIWRCLVRRRRRMGRDLGTSWSERRRGRWGCRWVGAWGCWGVLRRWR